MAAIAHMQCSAPRVTASQLQPRAIRSLVMVPARCRAHARRAPLAPQAASSALATSSSNGAALAKDDVEVQYLTKRAADVTRHFPSALGVDDFMSRLEIALFQHGFQNDNSIGKPALLLSLENAHIDFAVLYPPWPSLDYLNLRFSPDRTAPLDWQAGC